MELACRAETCRIYAGERKQEADAATMTISTVWKSRPIFISSTFRDVQAERDAQKSATCIRTSTRCTQGACIEPMTGRRGKADLLSYLTGQRLRAVSCAEYYLANRESITIVLSLPLIWSSLALVGPATLRRTLPTEGDQLSG